MSDTSALEAPNLSPAVRARSDAARRWLGEGWQICSTEPQAVAEPQAGAGLKWSAPTRAGTAVAMLTALGAWPIETGA